MKKESALSGSNKICRSIRREGSGRTEEKSVCVTMTEQWGLEHVDLAGKVGSSSYSPT